MKTFNFIGTSRSQWLPEILKCHEIEDVCPDKTVRLNFSGVETPNNFEPFHFVLLACLIENLNHKGYDKIIFAGNNSISDFLLRTLKLGLYWHDENPQNYVPINNDNIFNLWKVNDQEKDVIGNMVGDYLIQRFFQNKDLSAVKASLTEAYYNIFDHADANGNAFSFIKFDEEQEKLSVAVCDFGKGIAYTIRQYFPDIKSDYQAIEKAIENNVTVRSKPHNRGFGLGNIISVLSERDSLNIFSNQGFMHIIGDDIKTFQNDCNFLGTLIYYEISLSHFPDMEINDNFVLDF